jgi:hypothetical protein
VQKVVTSLRISLRKSIPLTKRDRFTPHFKAAV